MRILSSVLLLLTPWSVTRQSLSVEFSRREYWSGLPSPPPRDTRTKKRKRKKKKFLRMSGKAPLKKYLLELASKHVIPQEKNAQMQKSGQGQKPAALAVSAGHAGAGSRDEAVERRVGIRSRKRSLILYSSVNFQLMSARPRASKQWLHQYGLFRETDPIGFLS